MNIRNQIKLVNAALSGTLDLYRIWAKKHGLSYNALVVLYTLEEQKTCTQKQISRCWGLPKQTVHSILMEFEQKGYLSITANAENKRERMVSFTEQGRDFASSLLKELHSMEEKAMEKLGEEKRNLLVVCNEEYYESLREEIERGC